MAKRTRRERKLETEKPVQPASEAAPSTVVAEPIAVMATAPEQNGVRKSVDFATEYYYVYADIRKVAIVTGSMFVLMFVLGYFI